MVGSVVIQVMMTAGAGAVAIWGEGTLTTVLFAMDCGLSEEFGLAYFIRSPVTSRRGMIARAARSPRR